jgi:transcriptional regulator with GAF, ATPase, and Fis domain/predicted negative regulator of RcsB-dependent stress response
LESVNQVVNRSSKTVLEGTLAGRYRPIRRLSTGSSGEVFLVEELVTGTQRAFKLVAADVAATGLRGEFARLSELDHPNIVRVIDAGIIQGGSFADRAFLVTDFVAGPSLAESLATLTDDRRFSTFASAAEALADALAYLHSKGVLHGDVSPANVRCDDRGRPVLIDFGLSERLDRGAAVAVSGTLGFIPPEALLGEIGPRKDLFALGATLYDAWTGSPPFGLGMESVRTMWQGPPAAPSALWPGLTVAWDDLLLRLLAATPEERPASARDVLRAFRAEMPGRSQAVESSLAAPFPAGDPLAGLVVGRAEERARLRIHLGQVAEGACAASVVCIIGAPGSGRHTLVARAVRDARLSVLAQSWGRLDIEQTDVVELLRQDEIAAAPSPKQREVLLEPTASAQEKYARLARSLETRAAERPLCLALAGSPEDEALANAIASGNTSGRLLVLLPCERSLARPNTAVIALTKLSREAIVELATSGAGRQPPPEIVDEIAAGSNGLAGAVTLLVRRWIDRVRGNTAFAGPLVDVGRDNVDFQRLLDASFASLRAEARALLVTIALTPAATVEKLDQVGGTAARAEAERAGWLDSRKPMLASELHLQAIWRGIAVDPALRIVARAAADALPADDTRLAEVDLALGERPRAAAEFVQAMRQYATAMAWSRAGACGLRALSVDAAVLTADDRLTLALVLGILGRYDEALGAIDECHPTDQAIRVAVIDRRAWLLGRRGDPAAARALLEAALVELGSHEGAGLLRARLARILISSGAFAEALAVVEPIFGSSGDAGTLAREVGVIALAYTGKVGQARALSSDLALCAQMVSDRLLLARALALSGLVEQLGGQPRQAAASYQEAVQIYERLHDLHGLAAASFNLGCTLAEIGDYGGSLGALDNAIRELGRLTALSDHALAVFNVGQLFLQLGDVAAATKAALAIENDASSLKVAVFDAYAALLRAQVERRTNAPAAARSYSRAIEGFSHAGMEPMATIASLEFAEVLAEENQLEKAGEVLRRCSTAEDATGKEGASPVAELAAAARARIALRDPSAKAQQLVALAAELAEHANHAKAVGRLPAAWRLAALAAQLFARAGDGRSDAEIEIARACFVEVKMKTPAQYWPGLEGDGEARILQLPTNEGRASHSSAERTTLLESHLRRLLRINKRLNSDLRLSRVLETIIDTVIELTDAERGFLLLRDGNGELTVKVARNMDQTSLEGSSSSLSRSIAKQAADTGEPVMAVDAAGDTRFAEHMSVSDLHLRSVLAVPLAVKGTVVGTIYVDHRLRKGVFGNDELAMVLDFAEQGAIAIENARVISELRRREQQVQALNRRLERELKAQEVALSDARIELKESRQVAALRYDYRQIIGQSPCMVELFGLLDRVTDTALPVVIEGESGTGKELVARAIHFNGSRKDRPFVSENCAAIPETLLESALFGHVRGSFTGADRDARGLFSIANGGTLFLDEVAEMSPAMQGKLLRVLQDGQYHRVGAERPEKSDVRIVVATNRNLTDMVEVGKFRKDLFYRLSVVRLHLPPLRERREDIPLLIRHFLQKDAQQAGATAKTVEPSALAKLGRYNWPGNVRELENEIARAGAFAGAGITIADLSPHIQTGEDPNETVRNEPDGLRIRHRVERLERQLIREALGRSQGNQTKAAALLGLSRFGLQKKLRRYNLGA